MLQALSRDLNAAFRRTVRRPVPALAVATTLALFIGAATTAFGLARAVLWRALPFADDGRLVFVWEDVERDGGMQAVRVTSSRYAAWRDHAAAAFSSIGVFGAAGFTLDTPAGHSLVMSEEDRSVVLKDQHGNRITLNQDGIAIESASQLVVKAAQQAQLEAGTSLSASAGSQLELSGSASATLSSAGSTSVQGSVVRIN